jgi:hypothetical protein
MPDDADTAVQYDQDYYLWALAQARALRSAGSALADLRSNDWRDRIADLDWESLAEEIESLGRRDRWEPGSRVETIIEHLTKLEDCSATAPRAGWQETVDRSRDEIETILHDSPSLRQAVSALVDEMTERGRRRDHWFGTESRRERQSRAKGIPPTLRTRS